MKRKFKVMVAGILSCIAIMQFESIFAATYRSDTEKAYSFDIQSVNEGYNSDPAMKQASSVNALVYLDATGSSGAKWPVNFIVIKSADSSQITNNVIMQPDIFARALTYNTSNRTYRGNVKLRANSGSTLVGFRASGRWIPNAGPVELGSLTTTESVE